MLILNSLVFLFAISFGTLILPSLVPKFSLLLLCLLCFSILLNVSFKSKSCEYKKDLNFILAINYNNIYIPLLAIFFLTLLLIIGSFDGAFNYFSNFGLLLIHVMFLVFILNSKEHIKLYLRLYVALVFIMALFSLMVTGLISLGLIDINAHQFSLNEATNGAFRRDAKVGGGGYSFPYGMGLILTGSGQLDLLGISFFRISGWAHEPTSATLFVVPAIMLLIHSKVINSSFTRYLFLSVILLFWVLAMSVGSMLALITVYLIVILSILYVKIFPLKLSVSILFILIIFSSIILFYVEPLIQSSIFFTKFDLSSETVRVAIDELTWFIPNIERDLNFYLSHIALWAIIFLFLYVSIHGIMYGKALNVYSIILLYLIIHSMKGSQESVFVHLYMFFWFYIAYFSASNKILASD